MNLVPFLVPYLVHKNIKPYKSVTYRVKMWYLQESNQGHKDFQSFALPTELRYHCFFFARANIYSFIREAKNHLINLVYFWT